jgi:hypothetical protein
VCARDFDFVSKASELGLWTSAWDRVAQAMRGFVESKRDVFEEVMRE